MKEMERLFTICIKDCNRKRIPLSEANALGIFTGVKNNGNQINTEERFISNAHIFE